MAFDLLQYICPPNGKQYRLFGLGDENCQCCQADDGWIEFRKNRHIEEFYVTDSVIGRGADTSEISNDGVNPTGKFYVQYMHNADGSLTYGAAWAKRQMSVGETFHRDCRVIVYRFDGSVLHEGDAATDLVVNAHHDRLTFAQSGITIEDVLELQWGGEEVYYYANGYGLVGWKNLRTGAGSFVGAFGAVVQDPFPHDVKPRPGVMRPTLIVPEPDLIPTFPAATNSQTMQVNQTSGLWLHAAPDLTGTHLRVLRHREVVTVFAEPVVHADGFNWQQVSTALGEQGWSAAVVANIPSFVPVDIPEPVVREPRPVPNFPDGAHPQQMQVNHTDGLWLLAAPGTNSGHLRVLRHREVVTVFAEPVVHADGFNWQQVSTALGEQGWSAAIVAGISSFVPLNAPEPVLSHDHDAPPHAGFRLAPPVTVPFRRSQPFGVNFTGQPDFYTRHGLPAHEGLDFGGILGDPIFAAADGTVVAINIPGENMVPIGHPYGIHVKVRHTFDGQTYQTDYCHLSSVAEGLAVGQSIVAGQRIGAMGNTGAANGFVHLHFNLHKKGATVAGEKQKLPDGAEVTYKNDIVDPAPYLE